MVIDDERLRFDELDSRWRRDGRHVLNGTVRRAKSIREDASRWALLINEETSVALVLGVRHCRNRWRNRANRRGLAVRTSRNAHRLVSTLLLLLQTGMISRDLSVIGQGFLR